MAPLKMGLLWLVLACILSMLHAQTILPLSDQQWSISGPALNFTVPGNLPSQIHLDLLQAGVIRECP